jgi:1-pyrroline-5-carboxylate dehydrogenase
MNNGYFKINDFKNEPSWGYVPSGANRDALLEKITEMRNGFLDIPLIIGGKEIRTGIRRIALFHMIRTR